LLIPAEEIQRSIRYVTLTKSTRVIPVFAGAAFKNMGVQPLLDAVIDYLPSPFEAGKNHVIVSVQGERALITAKEAGNVCALAFKVVQDAKRGVLVYVRVYSGWCQFTIHLFEAYNYRYTDSGLVRLQYESANAGESAETVANVRE